MKQLGERFADLVGAGTSVEQAIRVVLTEAAAELKAGNSRGSRPEEIARALGLDKLVGAGVAALLKFAATRWMDVQFSVFPREGGVRDIPRPDCIEEKLPKDRPATREDYLRAWNVCTGGRASENHHHLG